MVWRNEKEITGYKTKAYICETQTKIKFENQMNIEELEKLILQITSSTGLTSNEIAVDMGYNKGYISQIKSRNDIPDKFVNALKNKYLPEENNQPNPGFHEVIISQQVTIQSQQETIRDLVNRTRK